MLPALSFVINTSPVRHKQSKAIPFSVEAYSKDDAFYLLRYLVSFEHVGEDNAMYHWLFESQISSFALLGGRALIQPQKFVLDEDPMRSLKFGINTTIPTRSVGEKGRSRIRGQVKPCSPPSSIK